MFQDATPEEINRCMLQAHAAFQLYAETSLRQRSAFMYAIAAALEKDQEALLKMAHQETHLSLPRLKSELIRTAFQMRSYADFCASGQWMDIRIRKTDERMLTDLRKTQVPLGPVIVFGASNFPFAYSTPGGDTACALAAGCPVIVKGHPAHAATSEHAAKLIIDAAQKTGMPDAVFSHLHGAASAVGEALVKHPFTKAVGFTGSFAGGKQLFDWGNQRPEPIPVFAEMGSVNPVFLLPEILNEQAENIAISLANSMTQSVGQFCTQPGIIIGVGSTALDRFTQKMNLLLQQVSPAAMLHAGMAKQYAQKTNRVLAQTGIHIISGEGKPAESSNASPMLLRCDAKTFIENPMLREEIFGPFSLLIACENSLELLDVSNHIQGQLTCSLFGTEAEIAVHKNLLNSLIVKAGRIIYNGVPTGVQVDLAMMHGGPFPATTDARYTAVGADGIRRFSRPVTYQNFPEKALPPALQDDNPWNIYRTINEKSGFH